MAHIVEGVEGVAMATLGYSDGINWDLLALVLRSYSERSLDTGYVASATSTTLTDATKDWATDEFKYAFVEITKGTGAGQVREIVSNTSNTLTVSSAWTITPDTTSEYRIFGAPELVKQLININSKLEDPILDTLILNSATVNSAGDSGNLTIKGAKHVDVLIYVGAPTGSPSIQFHLQVIEPESGKVIRTYDGSTLTSESPDWITVDGLLLGTTVKVTWDGTLNATNYFSGVYCRLVAKR